MIIMLAKVGEVHKINIIMATMKMNAVLSRAEKWDEENIKRVVESKRRHAVWPCYVEMRLPPSQVSIILS